jgi:Aminopeptidase N
MSYRKLMAMAIAFVMLLASMVVAFAAGGSIEGTVTDPKKAVVVGAAVSVLNPVTNQSFTATTDAQGRFKVEGLSAGIYRLTISATGFNDAVRQNVKVEENKNAVVDVQLEIAPVTAGVQTSAKANSDPLYQQLRQLAGRADAFSGSYASVNNLTLKRDAATFTLRTGEIYFLAPVEGRTIAAVFVGSGSIDFFPPTEAERRSLDIFTSGGGGSGLREEFSYLVMRFTDQTFEEVKQSPGVTMQSGGGAQAEKVRGLYRARENSLRKEIRYNLDARTLADLYAAPRAGYFYAFIGGRRFDRLIFQLDPLGVLDSTPDQVSLRSYSQSDGGIWASFNLAKDSPQVAGTGAPDRRVYDITRHEIDGQIRGTRIQATDRVTWTARVAGTRVLPFDLHRSLRVSRVQDEEGRDLSFIQEEKDADADFAVVLQQAAEVGKSYKLTIQYEGDGAMSNSGDGNFILLDREKWYPSNSGSTFGDRARFEITFRYPKGNMFVATGSPVGTETQEGDVKISKWTSGETELPVAGFNYGKFKRKDLTDKETGHGIEFYANTEVPNELKEAEIFQDRMSQERVYITGITGKLSTSHTADAALSDTQNAMRIYTSYFGKLSYSRIAMTQQPAWYFGQSWPTLVYMPYVAFMDSTQREQLSDIQFSSNTFWRYVGPHEVSHQWWGGAVGWSSYRDQWMSEGFADFSTSLYIQYVRKDLTKFIDFWEEQRKMIVESSEETKNRKPYTVGPVTQGYRLDGGKTGSVYRRIAYGKGSYILHMLRMMMFDHKGGGDARFREMMNDFVKSYYNKDASTEDFKQVVEKHMSPQMDLEKTGRMDWFFNQWVYGTEVPAYRVDYSFGSEGGKPTMTARITQSGVTENFRMMVPIYADFGKGWTRLGAAALKGNSSVDLTNVPLPQQPKRITLCALNDVLATSIQSNKQ